MQKLPIGNDSFREIRENNKYYIDKTLFIRDFLQYDDKVTLITRPRRFGKTLNITSLKEFLDITAESRDIFEGLAIMDTEYAARINSFPVIYLSFKNCKAVTRESMLFLISETVFKEYQKCYSVLDGYTCQGDVYQSFFMIYEKLSKRDIDMNFLMISLEVLEQTLTEFYKIPPIVLIDEYDQPIVSSFEYEYHDELNTFFSVFYGMALKGQDCLRQAVLTGIQRIVKENIFSQLNNVRVFTVLDERYSAYFGLDERETGKLLADYGLALNDAVKRKYNGYIFGKTEMYNPWSLLSYADLGLLDNYWLNTSTNTLIRKVVVEAGDRFKRSFDSLICNATAKVGLDLSCSFIELKHNDTLWGLLANSGYITVTERLAETVMNVRIPNDEVRGEFMRIVADRANVDHRDLQAMFQCLFDKDMDGFMDIYSELVVSCTSYYDAKENAYHMLFLGMCISLSYLYKITSNMESGHGRHDILMESLSPDRPHVVIEFKQGENTEQLKNEALEQIIENGYYLGLSGEVLLLGIAHDKKRCEMAHKIIQA